MYYTVDNFYMALCFVECNPLIYVEMRQLRPPGIRYEKIAHFSDKTIENHSGKTPISNYFCRCKKLSTIEKLHPSKDVMADFNLLPISTNLPRRAVR